MTDDEAALIQQAQAGSQAAFAALVQRHGQMVFNLALRTLNDVQEAEEIAQETFIRAWQALPKFRAEAKLSTWLYRIATNLCHNRLPGLKRELSLLGTEEGIDVPHVRHNLEGDLVRAEGYERVLTAVNNLPESYRLLLTLRHWQGLSYQEIAEVTQMPLGTVKTGIFRARRLLRESLVGEEQAHG